MEKALSKWIKLTGVVFLLALLFGITTQAAPSAPSRLRQTYDYENAVEIGWDTVTGSNIRYQVEYSQDKLKWGVAHTNEISENSYTIGGLSTGKTFYFRVRAYEKGTSDYSNWSSTLDATTSPGTISSVQQTNATKKSVTLKWTAAAGANSYEVYHYDYINDKLLNLAKKTSSLNLTINNLKNSKQYAFMVFPLRTCGSYISFNKGKGIYVSLVPGKVSGFKLSEGDTNSSEVLVKWKAKSLVDGYEIISYNNKGKKVKKITINSYASKAAILNKIKSTSFYKVRIRAFVKLSNGKKYGAWSETYLTTQPKLDGTLQGGKATIKWSKVAGATSYTIYASTKTTGFKKIATTKGTSYVISKIGNQGLQSGRYYHFKVVSHKKVKGKTYKSSSNQYASGYMPYY